MNTPFLITNIDSTELSAADKQLLTHPGLAGVILFADNYANPAQLQQLCTDIKAINPQLLLTVDQEGGRVMRLVDGFTQVASMREFGAQYHSHPEQAKTALYDAITQLAGELRACAVDLTFAPVLDLDDGVSQVIGTRALATEPEGVVALATMYCQALQAQGMPAIGKHFPGHGGVSADSHYELPVDQRAFADVQATGLAPFARLVQQLDAIMSAHIIFPNIDAMPATFSSYWLQSILREQLGFTGIIFSDDLSMQATHRYGSLIERAQLALSAGCDIVLACHCRQEVQALLDSQFFEQDSTRASRVQQFIIQYGSLSDVSLS